MGFANTVTIVTQPSQSAANWSRAQPSVNQEYIVSNFGGGGGQLVVRVCDMVAGTPDVARTLVYVTNVQTLSCFNIQPSTIPTNLPSMAPTNSPQISDAPTPSISSRMF